LTIFLNLQLLDKFLQKFSFKSLLKSKALFTRDILAHNIAIKNIFEPKVSFGQGKLLAQGTLNSFLSLPWLGIEAYGSKISFYRNIVCKNIVCE
jgi:hypothetical protein